MTADINLWTEAEHAQRYLRDRAGYPRRREGYAALAELLPPAPGRVLDLGCGDGEVIGRVLDAIPGVEGMAVDFSAEMLGRTRARFADDSRVTVVEHDLDDPLPEEWGRFDAVVSAFAIHHVVDERKRALYTEVFDVLEPKGVFANLEHVASPTDGLHEEFLHAFDMTLDQDDPSNKLAPVETQLRWLREIGFADVDCHWKWRELALLAGVAPLG